MTDSPVVLLAVSIKNADMIPFIAALGVTLVAVPVVRRIAVTLGLYDRPDAGLKPHERPIPYLGGVAMYFGWLAALAWTLPLLNEGREKLGWIAAGGTLLMLTGLTDDLRHLRPKTRLLLQSIVAACLLYGGVGGHLWSSILLPIRPYLPEIIFAAPITVFMNWLICSFVIAAASNSTNLIDGLDGLCAGVLSFVALGFLGVSAVLASNDVTDLGGPLRTALSFGLLGACLGFLVYNFNPASIFMGDSGSLLLGYNVAVLLILFAEPPTWKWIAGAVMVFGFPVFDTALAITRRKLNGRPLFAGDRSHFYDQLRDRGLSVRKTAMICYISSAVLAALGVFLVTLSIGYLIVVYVLTPPLVFLLCKRFGMLRVDDAAHRSGPS